MAREFWRANQMVEPLCAVFLSDDTGASWKLFLDDEDQTWKVEQTGEVPQSGTVDGDAEFRYPTVDLLKKYPIEGLLIQGFLERDTAAAAEAEVYFENGISLIFTYEYATEKSFCNLVTG